MKYSTTEEKINTRTQVTDLKDMEMKSIELEACTHVMLLMIAELWAHHKDQPVYQVILQLEQDIHKKYMKLMEQYRTTGKLRSIFPLTETPDHDTMKHTP